MLNPKYKLTEYTWFCPKHWKLTTWTYSDYFVQWVPKECSTCTKIRHAEEKAKWDALTDAQKREMAEKAEALRKARVQCLKELYGNYE